MIRPRLLALVRHYQHDRDTPKPGEHAAQHALYPSRRERVERVQADKKSAGTATTVRRTTEGKHPSNDRA